MPVCTLMLVGVDEVTPFHDVKIVSLLNVPCTPTCKLNDTLVVPRSVLLQVVNVDVVARSWSKDPPRRLGVRDVQIHSRQKKNSTDVGFISLTQERIHDDGLV